MLWMFIGVTAASEPSLWEQAQLSQLYQTTDDDRTQADAAYLSQLLDEYSSRAEQVFIGEIVHMYHPSGHEAGGTRLGMLVSEVLRGEVPVLAEVDLPPSGGYIDGDLATAPVRPVLGYQVLVFTDADGDVLTSNALFLVEGGFIWRNKEPDVFLNPRIQQDWGELMDPSRDYLFGSLTAVRQALVSQDRRR